MDLLVTITSQLKTNSSTLIETKCWFSSHADVLNASDTKMRIYARVTKGQNSAIVGAKVK